MESIDFQSLVLVILVLSLGGAMAGILAGLFGIGGGTVLVPLLYEFLSFSNVAPEWRMHVAIGTSLAIIVPTSLRSYLGHRSLGFADKVLLRRWTIPVPLGVVAGALLASSVPSLALKLIFSAICVLTAFRFLFMTHARWRLGADMPNGFATSLQGFGVGFFASLMGMGGGMFAAMLLALYNRPIHQAVATSAGVGILVSIPGTIGYAIAGITVMDKLAFWPIGFIALIPVMLIGPISALTTVYGVRLAHKFSKRKLEIAFSIYLLLIAGRFFIDLFDWF